VVGLTLQRHTGCACYFASYDLTGRPGIGIPPRFAIFSFTRGGPMRVAGGTVILCALVGTMGAGCRLSPNPPDRPRSSAISRSLAPMVPPEALIVQSVLLERPIGDAFLDRELWESTLPVGEPETRALHAENGLRAGILSGTLPQRFQDLLNSSAETVSPHELSFNTRTEAVIPTAGPIDSCRFALLADLAVQPRTIELKQARCGIQVKPQIVEGGRVKVACEPRIQHGERRDRYRPTEDGTGFARVEEIPLEKFPKLGFEVTLGPNDCLVLGWNADRPKTIGEALFAVEVDNRPRQRVLVIRARQNGRSPTSDLPVIAGPYRR